MIIISVLIIIVVVLINGKYIDFLFLQCGNVILNQGICCLKEI